MLSILKARCLETKHCVFFVKYLEIFIDIYEDIMQSNITIILKIDTMSYLFVNLWMS